MNTLGKILIVGIALILLSSCEKQEITSIPLWEITKDNAKTSYIAGTIEYLPKEKGETMFTKRLNDAFENSGVYIPHINVQDSDMLLAMKELEIGSNQTLKGVLPQEAFNRLSIMKNEWDTKTPNSIQPPDSVKIKLIFYLQDIAFYDNKNSFLFFQHWARKAMPMNKNISGLETWQDGFRSMGEVSLEDQIKFMNSIQDFDSFRKMLKGNTEEFYLKEEWLLLKDFYRTQFPFLKDYNETLIKEKHQDWAEKLNAAMDTSSCFISIDVTHLVGDDNLIDELLSKGYKVSKIE
ncbi:MAG: TraB/GumN family protein [Flavobacteriales bacterium]